MTLRSFLLIYGVALFCVPLAQAGDMPEFQVTAKDGSLSPAHLEVPAGRKIKLLIKNEGPGPIEFENAELRVEKVLAPGASSFIVIHQFKPGSYRFFDEFHPASGQCVITAK